MTTALEIAQIIKSQIPARELMAIGAKNFMAVRGNDTHLGGLMFSASLFGRKNCQVCVKLNGQDLYDFTVCSRSGKVLCEQKDVFCDDMGPEVILACERYFAS